MLGGFTAHPLQKLSQQWQVWTQKTNDDEIIQCNEEKCHGHLSFNQAIITMQ